MTQLISNATDTNISLFPFLSPFSEVQLHFHLVCASNLVDSFTGVWFVLPPNAIIYHEMVAAGHKTQNNFINIRVWVSNFRCQSAS